MCIKRNCLIFCKKIQSRTEACFSSSYIRRRQYKRECDALHRSHDGSKTDYDSLYLALFLSFERFGVAKAYWDDTDGIIPNMKKVMKFHFREFPELVKNVENNEITPEMFRKYPSIVLPIMDRTYQPGCDR